MTMSTPPQEKTGNSAGLAGFIIALISPAGCGVLSLLGIIVSLFGMKRPPRGLATTGLVLSLLTGVAWVAMYWVGVSAIMGVVSSITYKSVPAQVWFEAGKAGKQLAQHPPSGDSGTVPNMAVYYKDDMRIPLLVNWSRSGDEYVVTATLDGSLPEGVKQTSATVNVLQSGDIVLGFPELHEWTAANKGFVQDLIKPLVTALLNTFESEVKIIKEWEASHDGKLPGDEVGNTLFAKVPRTITQSDGKSTLRIDNLVYRLTPEGHFELSMTFEAKINTTTTQSSIKAVFTQDGRMVDPFNTFGGMGFGIDGFGSSGP
ncbi:MAG: hypothetical protein MK085_02115 [Phycisphaerales bacterium]|nr:hypothetical protein [Phycisphaerales bacterium]